MPLKYLTFAETEQQAPGEQQYVAGGRRRYSPRGRGANQARERTEPESAHHAALAADPVGEITRMVARENRRAAIPTASPRSALPGCSCLFT
jgi:hypothetical protein